MEKSMSVKSNGPGGDSASQVRANGVQTTVRPREGIGRWANDAKRLGLISFTALGLALSAKAADLRVTWVLPDEGTNVIVGFNVYYGANADIYTNFVAIGKSRNSLSGLPANIGAVYKTDIPPVALTSLVLTGLEPGSKYHLAMTAVGADDKESGFSDDVGVSITPLAPTGFHVQSINIIWKPAPTNSTADIFPLDLKRAETKRVALRRETL